MSADEFDVPSGERVHECERCEAVFPDADLLALHRGLDHYGALDDEEVAAYEAAHDAESAALRRFRLKMLGALVILYFTLFFAYALLA